MAGLDPGTLDTRLHIERPRPGDAFDSAGSGEWVPVRRVWANVKDMLPSRGERLADGINVASRPARVRMYRRSDVTADMRFILRGRVMQIVAGPADFADDGMEFKVEEYSPAGNAA
jgi:head-tail adaptor